jgi:hypothetical protein
MENAFVQKLMAERWNGVMLGFNPFKVTGTIKGLITSPSLLLPSQIIYTYICVCNKYPLLFSMTHLRCQQPEKGGEVNHHNFSFNLRLLHPYTYGVIKASGPWR